ncbi:MAG: hypothetical protein ABSD74_19175 [Rhizomicrobium sp.]
MRSIVSASLVVAAGISLSACATPPEDIQATVVSPALYDYLDCRQLVDYAASLQATYQLAADQQDKARYEDAIGYIVLQQPLGSERRGSVPAEIADIKGRLVAVHELETSKNCGQRQVSLVTPSQSESAR